MKAFIESNENYLGSYSKKVVVTIGIQYPNVKDELQDMLLMIMTSIQVHDLYSSQKKILYTLDEYAISWSDGIA